MLKKAARLAVVAVCLAAITGAAGTVWAEDAPAAQAPAQNSAQTPTPTPTNIPTVGSVSEIISKRNAVTSFVMVTTFKGQMYTQYTKVKDWKVVRMKVVCGPDIMYINIPEKVDYIYYPQAKAAWKLDGTKGTTTVKSETPFANIDDDPKYPKELDFQLLKNPVVTSETIYKVDCWKVTGEMKGKPAVGWYDKNYGLPIQTIVNGTTYGMYYTMINAVPDSEFVLPAGTTAKTFEEMITGK